MMKKFKLHIFIISIMLVLSHKQSLADSPVLLIGSELNGQLLGKFIEHFEDTTNSLHIDDILSASIPFVSINKNNFFFSYERTTNWFRLTIDNIKPYPIKFYIEYGFGCVDEINFYYKENEKYKNYTAGDTIPFNVRPIPYPHPVFSVTQSPGKKTYFIKINSPGKLWNKANIKIWDEHHFSVNKSNTMLVYGFYIGIMAILFCYNIVMFVWYFLKKTKYFYAHLSFALLTLALTYYPLYYYGVAFQYLWPNNPEINNFAYIQTFTIISTCVALYSMSFEELSHYYGQFLKTILFINLFLFFIVFKLDHYMSIRIVASANFIYMTVGSVWTFLEIKEKRPILGVFKTSIGYKFIIIATSTFCIFNSLAVLQRMDLIVNTFAMHYFVQFFSNSTIFILNVGFIFSYFQKASEDYDEQLIIILKMKENERIKTKFIHVISHELGTPVQAILDRGDIFQDVFGKEKKYKNHIKKLMDAINWIERLTDSILRFSRSEIHNSNLHANIENIELIIQDIINELSETVNKYNHNLIFIKDNKSKECEIMIDKMLIEIVFRNIILNALKYTQENGTIIISVNKNSKYIIVSVADNGVGISKSALNNIYDEFFQAKLYKSRRGGVGLGLTISKQFIEDHGGKIECKSPIPPEFSKGLTFENPDRKGTIFFIYLPINPNLKVK